MKTTLIRSFITIAIALSCGLATTVHAAGLTVSPSSVSNTYNGPITLTVTGLTNTETVVVQKFLDANTNGVIDSGDTLWEQFNVTDGQPGMVIAGVTNINVPGDTDGAANGAITAKLVFQFANSPTIAGNYLFKLSSPVGHFLPQTNSFAVTNFPFAQKFTGTVTSGGIPVPYASVILLQSQGGNNVNPVGGVVANSAGIYTLPAPAGTYVLAAFKTNYVANFMAAAGLVLPNGGTINTNLNLIAATQTISGKVIDTNTGAGLPGFLVPVESQTGLLGVTITDTNGIFTAGVTADQWRVQNDSSGATVHGYVGLQNNISIDTTTGSVANVTIALPKATALFYGTIKDNLGNPLPGVVAVYAYDNNFIGNGSYQGEGFTDANGNYVTAVLGGLGSNDPWQLQIDNSSSFPNYVFSQPAFNQNGGTNLSVGQALLVNFTAIIATNHITGNVKYNGTDLPGVGVYAYATISNVQYNAYTDTDNSGNYSLNVANGNWSVGVNQQGDNDSLDNLLGNGSYQSPNNVNVNISNSNGSASFNILPCAGVQIATTSPLPGGAVNSFYSIQFQGSSCGGNFNWSVNDPQNLPPGLNLYSDGTFNGTPTSSGNYNFSVNLNDGNGHSTNVAFAVFITGGGSPLQITTGSLPNGTNTIYYSQTLQATGGTSPYSWALSPGSAGLPPALTLSSGGVISGTAATNGTFYFYVSVTDATAATTNQLFSITLNSIPLQVTTGSLPSATQNAAYNTSLSASGGQPPYVWSLAPGSASLPAGLSLGTNGIISGTPIGSGTSQFIALVTDSAATWVYQVFSITVNASGLPQMVNLTSPTKTGSGAFRFTFNIASGVTYTIQYSSNITTWMDYQTFTFNDGSNSGGSQTVTIPIMAGAGKSFYRVKVGP